MVLPFKLYINIFLEPVKGGIKKTQTRNSNVINRNHIPIYKS